MKFPIKQAEPYHDLATVQASNLLKQVLLKNAIAALNFTNRLKAITVPTLIIVGEDDQGTPVAASRAIHEQIKGSELVILKSAAHLSNLEQPQAFNGALTAFLARVAPRALGASSA